MPVIIDIELEEKAEKVLRRGREKAVLILSGGVDSTTLLYDLISQKKTVYTITFYYGQKHSKEALIAVDHCKVLGIPNKFVKLEILGELAPSSLTRVDQKVPEGSYAEESMKSTVVPNRNMVFISLAVSYAIGIGAKAVYYGAHAGDHAIYPDCRPEFYLALNKAIQLCDWSTVVLEAPYLYLTKGDIVRRGKGLGVDYSKTWTCYMGEGEPCGKCGACVERAEAFEFAGIKDPLL